MRKVLIFVSIVAMMLAMAGFATGAAARSGGPDFKAQLNGNQEVPPVDTKTVGRAKFDVPRNLKKIDFKLEVFRAKDILAVAGAHLHCAPRGQNGPVVAFLAGAVPGGFDGHFKVEATLTKANIVDDSCGETIAELVRSMRKGKVYVNVHSEQHPNGVVRGQVRKN